MSQTELLVWYPNYIWSGTIFCIGVVTSDGDGPGVRSFFGLLLDTMCYIRHWTWAVICTRHNSSARWYRFWCHKLYFTWCKIYWIMWHHVIHCIVKTIQTRITEQKKTMFSSHEIQIVYPFRIVAQLKHFIGILTFLIPFWYKSIFLNTRYCINIFNSYMWVFCDIIAQYIWILYE